MNHLIKAAALAVLFGTAAVGGAAETITPKPDLNKIEQKIKSDLQQSIQKNGPEHEKTNDIRFSLAIFYAQAERFGEAEKYFRETFDIMKSLSAKTAQKNAPEQALTAGGALLQVYQLTGQLDKAAALAEELLECSKKTADPLSQDNLKIYAGYVALFKDSGRKMSGNAMDLLNSVKTAAENGSAPAQFYVALWYSAGGIYASAPDEAKSIEYLKKSAEAGYPVAQWFVGVALVNGQAGFTRDEKAGLELIKKAAKQGEKDALGWLQENIFQTENKD